MCLRGLLLLRITSCGNCNQIILKHLGRVIYSQRQRCLKSTRKKPFIRFNLARRRLENRSKNELKVTNNKRLEVRTSNGHVGLCLTFQEEERFFGDSIEREKQSGSRYGSNLAERTVRVLIVSSCYR